MNIKMFLKTLDLIENDDLRRLYTLITITNPLEDSFIGGYGFFEGKKSLIYKHKVPSIEKVISLIIEGIPLSNCKFSLTQYQDIRRIESLFFLNPTPQLIFRGHYIYLEEIK